MFSFGLDYIFWNTDLPLLFRLPLLKQSRSIISWGRHILLSWLKNNLPFLCFLTFTYVKWQKLICKSQIMSRNLGPNHLVWIDFVKTIISHIWAVSNCKIKYHLSQIATSFNHHSTSKTKICTLFFAWLCKKTGIVLWYQL